MTAEFQHQPVMLEEITEVFDDVPSGVIVDATLGGGGHSAALLARREDISILGIDRDPAALAAASDRLAAYRERFTEYRGRFDTLDDALEQRDIESISGALFDLGVSSHQLDVAERGFSYRNDGPVDMRMDPDSPWSAADIVNGYDELELADTIRRFGDERYARRIAAAIVGARPLESTAQLADVIANAIPAPARRTGGHPAKRTFQAIRIAVNDELGALPAALEHAIDRLDSGGRVAVLSYHSGEDRIVKQVLRDAATGGCECPPGLPCVCDAVATVRVVRAPKRPTAAEQNANPRSASARLRVAEKI